MLWLAIPRAVAGLILFDVDNTLSSLRFGEVVAAPARTKLMLRQREALAWSSAGGLLIDHAFAIMASRARAAGEKKAASNEAILAAKRALENGLARMPVSADGWYLLAVLRRSEVDNSAKTYSALRMSVYSGPHVPVLVILRLRLMLRLWPQFKKGERPMVYRQIRYAWSVAPNDVIDIAVNAQNDWPIRIALALQPKELQRFEEKLRAAKKATTAK